MRKRSCKFTTADSELLLTLIAKHREAIENVNTDNESAEEERRAWEIVEVEYNANCGNKYRSLQTLKTKYENIKARKKLLIESMAHENLQGDPPEINSTTVKEEPNQSEESLEQKDQNDDKSQVMADCLEACLDSFYKQSHLVIGNVSSLGTGVEVNEELNPDNNVSKTPVKRAANPRKRKRCVRDIWGDVAAAKLRKTELETEFLLHENKLKIRTMNMKIGNLKREEEKHNLELKLLRKEIQEALPEPVPGATKRKRYSKA